MKIINIYQGWADHGGGVQWATATNAQQVLTTGLLEMMKSISYEPPTPFPVLSIECPFSVRKPKSHDQSRQRLHWKLKNPSLEKKSIFTPLYVKVDLSATFTPIQSSNIPTRGDGQVRSDQIYQYILPARCSFFREHLLQSLYFCFYLQVLESGGKHKRLDSQPVSAWGLALSQDSRQ